MVRFYSNGKLLLTGEYVVLDGALSLAVPTIYGQSLSIQNIANKGISWKSYDCENSIWFEGKLNIAALKDRYNNDPVLKGLFDLLILISNKLSGSNARLTCLAHNESKFFYISSNSLFV